MSRYFKVKIEDQKIFKCVYVCVFMATKTISITEDAYNRLANLKNANESFSLVINRITNKEGRKKLSEFAGILSEKSARELEKNIKRFRKRDQEMHNNKIKEIEKMLK